MREKKKRYRSSKHHTCRSAYRRNSRYQNYQTKFEQEKSVSEEIKDAVSIGAGETAGKIQKQMQKKRIKRKYAEMKRKEQLEGLKERFKKSLKNIGFSVNSFSSRNVSRLLPVLAVSVIIVNMLGMCSSCTASFMSSTGAVLGTSYTAEDVDILGAEEDYGVLEDKLRNEIEKIEDDSPGYDEYRYELQEINHNPYQLLSYLTVQFEDFKRAEIQQELQNLYSRQYQLQLNEKIEIRTREEERIGYRTVIDEKTGKEKQEKYKYTETVEYEYRILCVKLVNYGLETVILNSELSEDQLERYQILMDTKGNRAYLFGDDIYSNEGEYLEYDIPGEALTDTEFAELIREAEKYLGKKYVWGGSTPQSGFDCSGYVCWVLNQTGKTVGRTTANGLLGKCDKIRSSEARPGDLIFFQETYDVPGASHVGIYVGNQMMIHAGNPISYASISSAYWQEHFYCFGRLS